MPELAQAAPPGRVLIAPNAFKGTLSAALAAQAIGAGVARAWPLARCRSMPLADGGDGFLETLLSVPGSDRFQIQVPGPLLEPVSASLGWLGGDRDRVAVVELANCCGLVLVGRPTPDTSLRASTRGLGELIVAALDQRAQRVLIGLGGSASTDGGAGLGQAFGFRFLDRSGEPIRPGGAGLLDLDRIEAPAASPRFPGPKLVAACDVDNPLLGKLGAAATFGPQKGADAQTVRLLERGLSRLAELVDRDLQLVRLDSQPGMGAAGGAAFGLAAFGGARLESGVALVAAAVGLDQALDEADLVITGEGRFDEASLRGKVTGEVVRRCGERQLTCLVLTGSVDASAQTEVRALGGRIMLTSPGGGPRRGISPEAAFSELREATTQACLGLGAV